MTIRIVGKSGITNLSALRAPSLKPREGNGAPNEILSEIILKILTNT
jgi:hypothetical protein